MKREDRKLTERLIIEEAMDLGVDESRNTFCPFCRARHESKLSITRTSEGLLYNCYRATCGARGFISSIPGTTHLSLQSKPLKFQPKEFTHALSDLPTEVIKSLYDKYELTEEEVNEQGFRWVPNQDRIYMPLFDRNGQKYGTNTKVYGRGATGPKTIIYRDRETSGLHYIRGSERRGGPIGITEDILSALKISRYVRTVALLGTSLRENQVEELREETDSLILMLDPDMYLKMLGYKKKYSFYFRNFSVVLLSKDPKDTQREELEKILRV